MSVNQRGSRKIKIGEVVSDKMDKTVIVRVARRASHSAYKKTITKMSKYKVHDEKNEAKAGDLVRIAETRPISKDKRWRLVEILKTG